MTSYERLSTFNLKREPSEKTKGLFYLLNTYYKENTEELYHSHTPNVILEDVGRFINLDSMLFRHKAYHNDSIDVDKFVGNLIVEASSQPSALVLLTNALTNRELFQNNVTNIPFEPEQAQPELIKQLENKPFDKQVEITADFLLNSFSEEILRIYGKSKGMGMLPEYLRRLTKILFLPIPGDFSLNNLRNPFEGSYYPSLFQKLNYVCLKDIADQAVMKTEEENQKRKKYQNLKTEYSFKIKHVNLKIDTKKNLVEVIAPEKKKPLINFAQIKKGSPKPVIASPIKKTSHQGQEHSGKLLDLIFKLTPEGKLLPQIEANLRLLSQIQCIFPEDPNELMKKLHSGSIKERQKIVSNLANGWTENMEGNQITFPGINSRRLEHQLKWILTQKDKQFLVFPFARVNGSPISWRNFMKKNNFYPEPSAKILNHNGVFSLPSINYDTAWDKNRQHGDIGEQTPTDGWAMIVIQDNNDNVGFADYYNDLMLPEYGITAFSLASIIKPHNISTLGNFLNEDYGTIFFPSTDDCDFHDIKLINRISNRKQPELWIQLYTKDYFKEMRNWKKQPEDRIKNFLFPPGIKNPSSKNAKIGFVLKIN